MPEQEPKQRRKRRVVVSISGGNVQGVVCDDKHTEVIIFDFDNLKQGLTKDLKEIVAGALPVFPGEAGRAAVTKCLKHLMRDTKEILDERTDQDEA